MLIHECELDLSRGFRNSDFGMHTTDIFFKFASGGLCSDSLTTDDRTKAYTFPLVLRDLSSCLLVDKL